MIVNITSKKLKIILLLIGAGVNNKCISGFTLAWLWFTGHMVLEKINDLTKTA